MLDDFRVPRLSNDEVERIAAAVRLVLFSVDDPGFDLLDRVKDAAKESGPLSGIEILERHDEELGRAEALAYPSQKRIHIRISVAKAVSDNEPRARMTLAHELGHVVLMHRAPAARMHDGNRTFGSIPSSESAEHQARVFAAALLMPANIARQCADAEDLVARCRVSRLAAQIRLEQLRMKGSRPEPPFVRQLIESLRGEEKPATLERRGSRILEEAWSRSALAPNLDPNEFRLCRAGLLVRKSDHCRRVDTGFIVEGGHIVSYRDLENR